MFDTDMVWADKVHKQALRLVMEVNWPWTDRQKILWFQGVMAFEFPRNVLEKASIEELQELYTKMMKDRNK